MNNQRHQNRSNVPLDTPPQELHQQDDPITHYYLQISDEANAQAAMDAQRKAENEDAMYSRCSGSESNSHDPIRPYRMSYEETTNMEHENMKQEDLMQVINVSEGSAESAAAELEQVGDFVHVHLEHLPSASGEEPPVHTQIVGMTTSTTSKEPDPKSKQGTKKRDKKAFAFHRKFATEGATTSSKTETGKRGILEAIKASFSSSGSSTKSRSKNSGSNASSKKTAKKGNTRYTQPASMNQRVQSIQGTFQPPKPISVSPLHSLTTGSTDANEMSSKDQRTLDKGPPVSNDVINKMYSHSLSMTTDADQSESEGDASQVYDLWQHRERELKKHMNRSMRDDKGHYRHMTFWQTLQHNTRANFCAVFLLGVALCCLILLVVAKLTQTTEAIFYDEDTDKNVIYKDNEKLITIELLALALILVLLLGSAVYCGVATCDRQRALVDQVKHKNACLANSSSRRRFPKIRSGLYARNPRSPTRSYSETTEQSNTDCNTNYDDEEDEFDRDRTLTSMEEATIHHNDYHEMSDLPYNTTATSNGWESQTSLQEDEDYITGDGNDYDSYSGKSQDELDAQRRTSNTSNSRMHSLDVRNGDEKKENDSSNKSSRKSGYLA